MTETAIKRRRRVNGCTDKRYPCRKLLTVAFEDEIFDTMSRMAAESGISASEQVRLLVEWGMEVVINDRP